MAARGRRFVMTACLLTVGAVLAGRPLPARAHGVVGERFFPATLSIDDPFVADELSLPTVSITKRHASADEPSTVETDFSAELSKRLSRNLGLSISGTLVLLDPTRGAPTIAGFDNMGLAVKYVFLKVPEHELLVSAGVDIDVGGTGQARIGAASFSTFTPSLFFGYGLGDLPAALRFLRPLAVTGAFGVALPVRVDPRVFEWGLTFQYNVQYLQSYVQDVGLPPPFNRMIPIVELPMETKIEGVARTAGTVNPGIIWFGRYIQLGLEAVIPVHGNTLDPADEPRQGSVGLLAQVHFYLDDIWPVVFTWTPIDGVLGPTQP